MAITFCYAPPPSPGPLRKRGISPPAPPVANHRWARRVSRTLIGGFPAASRALIGSPRCPSSAAPPPQTGVCRDVRGNEEVNNFDRVRFKATPFLLPSSGCTGSPCVCGITGLNVRDTRCAGGPRLSGRGTGPCSSRAPERLCCAAAAPPAPPLCVFVL